MTERPKRRWFRFSLIALVAALGCWISFQVNWIRQRHDALGIPVVADDTDPFGASPTSVAAPGLLWLFGERGYTILYLRQYRNNREPTEAELEPTNAELLEVDRLKRLFPEASIGYWMHRPVEPKRERIEAIAIAEVVRRTSLQPSVLLASARREGDDWWVYVGIRPAMPGFFYSLLMSRDGEVKKFIGGA